jgi:hypothetical protein
MANTTYTLFQWSRPHSDSMGIGGYMAKPVGLHDNSSLFAKDRYTLRNSWNTHKYIDTSGKTANAITPFRAVNNAGDPKGRTNYACGGSSQLTPSRPGIMALAGGSHWNCDGSGVPGACCNPKYVYDSSDYVRYKRQLALNHAYNDLSFGGDYSSTSQSALRAVR